MEIMIKIYLKEKVRTRGIETMDLFPELNEKNANSGEKSNLRKNDLQLLHKFSLGRQMEDSKEIWVMSERLRMRTTKMTDGGFGGVNGGNKMSFGGTGTKKP